MGPSDTRVASSMAAQKLIDEIFDCCCRGPTTSPKEIWTRHQELFGLVEKLRAVQNGRKRQLATTTGSQDFAPFTAWLESQGVVGLDKVEVAHFGEKEGNGLRAKVALAGGEHVLAVPEKALLSTQTAEASPLGRLLAGGDRMLRSMPNVLLAVHLLCEFYRDDSPWRPYIQILPSSFSTPLYYSLEQLELLRGSPVFLSAINLFQFVARQYAYFHRLFRKEEGGKVLPVPVEDFYYDDYRWAVSTVMTRENQLPVVADAAAGAAPEWMLALIPLWDMMNHRPGKMTTQHDAKAGRTEFAAMADTAAGEQVYMCYGARSNGEMLLHSGFVPDENADDMLLIKLGVAPKDPLHELKTKLLTNLSIPCSPGEFPLSLAPDLDPQLQAFIRITSMEDDELEFHLFKPEICADLGKETGMFHEENEEAACKLLKVRCELLQRTYNMADKEAKAAAAGFPGQCALALCRSELAILDATAKLMGTRLEALS